MNAANKMGSKILLTLGLIAPAIGMFSCGDDPITPGGGGGTEPGPKTEIKTISVTGVAGSVDFNKADSSLVFWQKSGDNLVQATISASTNAKGDDVTLENSLIRNDNVLRSAGQTIYLKTYDKGIAVYAPGKNIGQTEDGLNKVKELRFSGTKLAVYAEGMKNLDDVMNVMENPNLKWKLVGNQVKDSGKVYKLAVVN